jgi:threonyl-tRNA synthetase
MKIMSVAGAYWRGDEKQTVNTCLRNSFQNKRFNEYLLLLKRQNVAITEN